MGEPIPRWQIVGVLVLCVFNSAVRPGQSVVAAGNSVTGFVFDPIVAPAPDRGRDAAERPQSAAVPAAGNQAPGQPARNGVRAQGTAATTLSAPALKVYRTSCLLCHDVDGRGELGRDGAPSIPDFTDAMWHAARTDGQLSQSILEGKGKAMPRMKNKLGSVDVKLMVALVRAFRNGGLVVEEEPEAAEPAEQPARSPNPDNAARQSTSRLSPEKQLAMQEGRRLFQKSCARCHGRDGKGADARDNFPMIPDFSAGPWQQKRSDAQLLVSILDGKGTAMPAFRDKISRDRGRDIVTYIRTFAPAVARARGAASREFEAEYNKLAREFEDIAKQLRALSATAPDHIKDLPSTKNVPKNQ
jgi:mono/diheme cytochrome c family protein